MIQEVLDTTEERRLTKAARSRLSKETASERWKKRDGNQRVLLFNGPWQESLVSTQWGDLVEVTEEHHELVRLEPCMLKLLELCLDLLDGLGVRFSSLNIGMLARIGRLLLLRDKVDSVFGGLVFFFLSFYVSQLATCIFWTHSCVA
jgi:hypothetical protein